MDGGFFLCPDAWEFLLPAGVRHLRHAMAVCRAVRCCRSLRR